MNIQTILNLLHILEQLRKHDSWTRPQLEAHQAEALKIAALSYFKDPAKLSCCAE